MPPYPKRTKTRSWSRPLADLVGVAIDPILARQGFSDSELILNWDDIAGERLAANSRPIKLQWPPRPAGARVDMPPQPATLVIRVESGFAIELQHMADQVLARINAHLGWRCVGRLSFRQGPIERPDSEVRSHAAPSPEAFAAAEPHVVGIQTEPLRDALLRLGARVAEAKAAS